MSWGDPSWSNSSGVRLYEELTRTTYIVVAYTPVLEVICVSWKLPFWENNFLCIVPLNCYYLWLPAIRQSEGSLQTITVVVNPNSDFKIIGHRWVHARSDCNEDLLLAYVFCIGFAVNDQISPRGDNSQTLRTSHLKYISTIISKSFFVKVSNPDVKNPRPTKPSWFFEIRKASVCTDWVLHKLEIRSLFRRVNRCRYIYREVNRPVDNIGDAGWSDSNGEDIFYSKHSVKCRKLLQRRAYFKLVDSYKRRIFCRNWKDEWVSSSINREFHVGRIVSTCNVCNRINNLATICCTRGRQSICVPSIGEIDWKGVVGNSVAECLTFYGLLDARVDARIWHDLDSYRGRNLGFVIYRKIYRKNRNLIKETVNLNNVFSNISLTRRTYRH